MALVPPTGCGSETRCAETSTCHCASLCETLRLLISALLAAVKGARTVGEFFFPSQLATLDGDSPFSVCPGENNGNEHKIVLPLSTLSSPHLGGHAPAREVSAVLMESRRRRRMIYYWVNAAKCYLRKAGGIGIYEDIFFNRAAVDMRTFSKASPTIQTQHLSE